MADQAAQWATLIDRDPAEGARAPFRRWLDADPRHVLAFEQAQAMLGDVSNLRGSAALGGRRLRSGHFRGQRDNRLALAASIVAFFVLAPAAYVAIGAFHRPRIEAVMLSTDIGQIREVPLADGTRVTLDTASAVRLE